MASTGVPLSIIVVALRETTAVSVVQSGDRPLDGLGRCLVLATLMRSEGQ